MPMTHNGFYRDLFFFDLHQFCEHQAYVNACSNLIIFQLSCQLPTRLHRVSTHMKLSCWTFVKVPEMPNTGAYPTFLAIPWLRNSRFPTAFPSVVWALETPSKSALRRFRSLVYSFTTVSETQGETPWRVKLFLRTMTGFWDSRWNTCRVKSYMEDRKAYIQVAYIYNIIALRVYSFLQHFQKIWLLKKEGSGQVRQLQCIYHRSMFEPDNCWGPPHIPLLGAPSRNESTTV